MCQSRTEKIGYAFLVAVMLFLIGLKFYAVLSINVPRELREGTLVAFAKAFSEGGNLYSTKTLQYEIPAPTTLYGFFVPLILSPFVKVGSLCGIEALRVCQVITLVIEVVGLTFAYKLVLGKTNNRIYAIAAAILCYSCYWRYDACGGAYADQWGVSLLIILAYFIYADGQTKKFHPITYTVVVLMLFYIKSYFAFVTIGVLVFLWIESKKDFGKLFFYGCVIGVGSLVVVNYIFPLYFTEILAVGQGTTFNCGFRFSLRQIWEMTTKYYLLIVLFFLLLIAKMFLKLIKRKEAKQNLWMFIKKYNSFEMCELIAILPLTIVIARNGGTYYTYYLQLWWIWMILFVVENLDKIMSMFRASGKMRVVILFLFLGCSIIMCREFIVSTPLSESQKADWKDVYSVLDKYAEEGEVLVSAHLSTWCMEHNVITAEYGQQEFNSLDNLDNYNHNALWKNMFPLAEDVLLNSINYNDKIKEKIEKQEFSCIALTSATRYNIEDEFLIQHGYTILDARTLYTGTQQWYTEIWVVQ